MKKINLIILFFTALFFIFTCSEPGENNSSNSKDLVPNGTYFKEFTSPGEHYWTVPENILGSITVTIVGGGGGGGCTDVATNAGGGGAGQRIVQSIELTKYKIILITVGSGGKGGEFDGLYSCDGDSGTVSKIITEFGTTTALAGSGGISGARGGFGGSVYFPGDGGNADRGGNGGTNGGGFGVGGYMNKGGSAPANSGGGGGGGGKGYDGAHSGGNGGSGYVKIVYTLDEK